MGCNEFLLADLTAIKVYSREAFILFKDSPRHLVRCFYGSGMSRPSLKKALLVCLLIVGMAAQTAGGGYFAGTADAGGFYSVSGENTPRPIAKDGDARFFADLARSLCFAGKGESGQPGKADSGKTEQSRHCPFCIISVNPFVFASGVLPPQIFPRVVISASQPFLRAAAPFPRLQGDGPSRAPPSSIA